MFGKSKTDHTSRNNKATMRDMIQVERFTDSDSEKSRSESYSPSNNQESTESPNDKISSNLSSETREGDANFISNILSASKNKKFYIKSRQNILNKSSKKRLSKSKRKMSAKKRPQFCQKLNTDRIPRKATQHRSSKKENKDRNKSTLFPPIRKFEKCKTSNESSSHYNSNFANNIKQKMKQEFVFKQSAQWNLKKPQSKRLSDFVSEMRSDWNKFAEMNRKAKRLSDPIEMMNSNYLTNFNSTAKNASSPISKADCFSSPIKLYRYA